MKRIHQFLLVGSLLSLAACSKSKDEAAPDPATSQAGYVTGRVVDAQGRPIKDAEVIANNTGAFVGNLVGYTDASGNYRIKLNSGAQLGAYYVRGHVRYTFESQPYNLMLLTESDRMFTAEEGAVRNMHLTLSGDRTQNVSDIGYFGGTLEVDNHTSSTRFPNIEVTLEPVGPLVDGSTGQTLTAKPDWLYSYNIPVGKYRITVRDVATNRALKVKNYHHDQGFQSSIVATFEAIQAGGDRYGLVIDVTD